MDSTIDAQSPYLIDMLTRMTGIALARGANELATPMLEAVRRIRPGSPRLDSFEGWLCIQRGDLVGATRHLTAAVEALGPRAGSARALLAMVNCALGDPVWATQAQAVVDDNPDPDSVGLVQAMRGVTDAAPAAAGPPATPAVSADAAVRERRRYAVRG